MRGIHALIDALREERAPDPRLVVFEVRVEEDAGGLALTGETTAPALVAELLERIAGGGLPAPADRVLRLPDPALAPEGAAVVCTGITPVYEAPAVKAAQVSQYVLGHRLELLSCRGRWFRVRGEDGYAGWTHAGYLVRGTRDWASAWERGGGGEPVVSLGAQLLDADGEIRARLPWGARVLRRTGDEYLLPGDAAGYRAAGDLVAVDRLADRFPPRGESIVRTARRWLGVPYLWGGVTQGGADCSGFLQSVLWMHGIALPRDSDLQARVGVALDPGSDFAALRAGDLLFFREDGVARVTHVALSAGAGAIIHAALGNGRVALNDLNGTLDYEARLRSLFVTARRVLQD
jgi:gamma-D-glutamyl-L-lysine dipeptidyl-peptidase